MTGIRIFQARWPASDVSALVDAYDVVVLTSTGRDVVREVIGAAHGLDPADVDVQSGKHGKPFVTVPFDAPPLWFSTSDTGDLQVIALSRVGEVGVDVERVRDVPDWRRIAARVLNFAEQAELVFAVERGVHPGDAFLRQWCRLEAELKAVGSGLAGLDARRRGGRPEGFRLADLTGLPIPAQLADDGARYHAAVALCEPSTDRVPCRSK